MEALNFHEVDFHPDSPPGGPGSPIVRNAEDAMKAWTAGHELAERYELRAEYAHDRRLAGLLRRAAELLRGL